MRWIAPSVSLIVLSGCVSGAITRVQAVKPPGASNSIIVNATKEQVWAKAIPVLGKTFFVINNLDKPSGLINVSYSGDPEKYVDGGVINSYVTGPRGDFRASFPASRASMTYNAMTEMSNGVNAYSTIQRTLALEGRANIIVEDDAPGKTKVTVNVRYILTKSGSIFVMGNPPFPFHGVASMTTGGETVFPGERDVYYPTGKLEEEILKAFQ